jgi:hypothetical protein
MSKIKYCWNCNSEVPYQIYGSINFVPKCPNCKSLYPEKPKDEAMLSIAQDDYLNNRTDDNFNKLFKLLNKMTFNVICHKLKSKSSHENLDDICDKVQWTLEKLTKYYKEKSDFKVTTSFNQYIGQLVLYPLYNKDEQDRHKNEISLYTPMFGNDKSSKELNDYLSKSCDGKINEVEKEIDYEINSNVLVSKSLKFINESIESMYEYECSKNTNKEFRNSYFLAELYKFFIKNKLKDDVVEDIINSLDYSLIKKFNVCKDKYKEFLMEYANE